MDNAPDGIRVAVRQQLVEPLIAVLTGQLPVRTIEDRLARTVARRLAVASRKPVGRTKIRRIPVQALPGSLEVVAIVEIDGHVHGLAIRVELRHERPTVVRVEAPSLF